MIMRLAALILLGTASVIQTAGASHPNSLMEVDLGDNVTLDCKVSEKYLRSLYWYKQPLGQVLQTVASEVHGKTSLRGQFKDPRFTVTKEESQYVLTIRNVSKEDEATYFCQSESVYSHMFINGTFLAMKDHNQQKSVDVKQSPRTESVQLGDPVTLQCSLLTDNKENQCEHSVYWFRAGSGGSHPSIIYTHRNSSDGDVERRCAYSLSKTIQTTSDVGTYYCAVVTCGEILFGEGTKVETRPELDPVVLVLGVLLACCVTASTLIIFYIKRSSVCEHCKGKRSASHDLGPDMATVDQSNDVTMNYAALDFSTRGAQRKKKRRESPPDCVYSAVSSSYNNQPHPSL